MNYAVGFGSQHTQRWGSEIVGQMIAAVEKTAMENWQRDKDLGKVIPGGPGELATNGSVVIGDRDLASETGAVSVRLHHGGP